MKHIRFVVVVLALSGCVNLDSVESVLADKGAKASDHIAEVAEFALCRGISVGAWVRRYGSNPALAEAWRVLCGTELKVTPTTVK